MPEISRFFGMRDVIDVEPTGESRLVLTFEGGECRKIDLAKMLSFTGVFEPLKDPACFQSVRVEPDVGTVVWPNGADLCPDVLYEKSVPIA